MNRLHRTWYTIQLLRVCRPCVIHIFIGCDGLPGILGCTQLPPDCMVELVCKKLWRTHTHSTQYTSIKEYILNICGRELSHCGRKYIIEYLWSDLLIFSSPNLLTTSSNRFLCNNRFLLHCLYLLTVLDITPATTTKGLCAGCDYSHGLWPHTQLCILSMLQLTCSFFERWQL